MYVPSSYFNVFSPWILKSSEITHNYPRSQAERMSVNHYKQHFTLIMDRISHQTSIIEHSPHHYLITTLLIKTINKSVKKGTK